MMTTPSSPLRAALALGLGLALGAASAAVAQPRQTPKELSRFADWTALSYREDKNDVCYAASYPKKEEGHKSKPGETNLLVTHWPSQKHFGVLSVTADYAFKKGSNVELEIDKNKFQLFTDGKTAWAPEGDDAKIVKAMKAGNQLIVRGTTEQGKRTTDIYSLRGFSKALEAASKACGVKG
jgi:invasion protein IalB